MSAKHLPSLICCPTSWKPAFGKMMSGCCAIKFSISFSSIICLLCVSSYNDRQSLLAWRGRAFRSTSLSPSTNVNRKHNFSINHFTPTFAKHILAAGILLYRLSVCIGYNSFVAGFNEVHYPFLIHKIFFNVRKCWFCFKVVKR